MTWPYTIYIIVVGKLQKLAKAKSTIDSEPSISISQTVCTPIVCAVHFTKSLRKNSEPVTTNCYWQASSVMFGEPIFR